jgi:hypothetical protein
MSVSLSRKESSASCAMPLTYKKARWLFPGKTLLEQSLFRASCGEALYLSDESKEAYQRQAELRYQLEPFIPDFAGFHDCKGKKVLEIGVGLGADHQQFAGGGDTDRR